MYETYLRLGYSEDFVRASATNWGLKGIQLAQAVVLATQEADKRTTNRVSMEWFEAYRDAFEKIIREWSPSLNSELQEERSVRENQFDSEGFPNMSKDNSLNEVKESNLPTEVSKVDVSNNNLKDVQEEDLKFFSFKEFDGKLIYMLVLNELDRILK